MREFKELYESSPSENQAQTEPTVFALEVGCGVGNTVFPLLQELPNLFMYAMDFAPTVRQSAPRVSCG